MQMAEPSKRQVAMKVRLRDITEGSYVKVEGEWEPNFIQAADGRRFSRVNVIAVVASEPDPGFGSFVLDDGTAQATVRSFGDAKFDMKLGDIVLLVGRPREYNSERYIMPEIVKRISDSGWVEHRKIELGEAVKEPLMTTTPAETLIEAIRRLDSGDGADTESVVSSSKIADAERLIEMLMKEGEIFELTPGRIKVLE
jgi:RPA family protein